MPDSSRRDAHDELLLPCWRPSDGRHGLLARIGHATPKHATLRRRGDERARGSCPATQWRSRARRSGSEVFPFCTALRLRPHTDTAHRAQHVPAQCARAHSESAGCRERALACEAGRREACRAIEGAVFDLLRPYQGEEDVVEQFGRCALASTASAAQRWRSASSMPSSSGIARRGRHHQRRGASRSSGRHAALMRATAGPGATGPAEEKATSSSREGR